MLLLGDLLRLHVYSEAEKFLKPWWDVVIDYLNLVLVMIAVVCGVVGLYAPGPVCIPVLRCPAHNSSLQKREMCAMIRNSSENGENSLNITAAVPFSNRNMFDYINSECTESICYLVRFFPNVLIVAAGCCVVCSAAWFALKSHILEEFSYLLQQCYKHAGSKNTATKSNVNNSTSTTTCTFDEHSPSVTFTISVKQHEGSAPPSAIEEDRNRLGERLENFRKDFHKNDVGVCRCFCCLCFASCCRCCTSTEPVVNGELEEQALNPPPRQDIEGGRNRLGERLENFRKDFHENDVGVCRCFCCLCFASCCRCCTSTEPVVNGELEEQALNPPPRQDIEGGRNRVRNTSNLCSGKCSYVIISFIQAVVSAVTSILVLCLYKKEINRQYECNISEKIPGLVYDHFVCSDSISQFYSLCAILFVVTSGSHMAFSLFKLYVIRKLFWKLDFTVGEPPGLTFMLKLVEFSNPAYVEPFRDMYRPFS